MVNWLLANFFAKPKSKPVARFDVITNFLVSKSANWVRLAHWPRRGALCGQSKGGGSMSHFPVKFAPAMQKGSMKCLPHSILLDLFISTRYLLGATLGALGRPGTGVPRRWDQLLATTFFDTKVLYFSIAV